MENPKIIHLTYTEEEWRILRAIAGKQTVRSWVNREINTLAQKVAQENGCLDCIGKAEKHKQNFHLQAYAENEIICLSQRFGIANATVIQKFIIDRHLIQYYYTEGFPIGG